jgi:hypothetical protein
MMVQMTLSGSVQNKVLRALSQIGINETYPESHVLTLRPHIFGTFIAFCSKLDTPPTLKELNIEWIDLVKAPRRTVMKYDRMPYGAEYTIDR